MNSDYATIVERLEAARSAIGVATSALTSAMDDAMENRDDWDMSVAIERIHDKVLENCPLIDGVMEAAMDEHPREYHL